MTNQAQKQKKQKRQGIPLVFGGVGKREYYKGVSVGESVDDHADRVSSEYGLDGGMTLASFFGGCGKKGEYGRRWGGFMILIAGLGLTAHFIIRAIERSQEKLVSTDMYVRHAGLLIFACVVAIAMFAKTVNALRSKWRDPLSKGITTLAVLSIGTGAALWYFYTEHDVANKAAQVTAEIMIACGLGLGSFMAATNPDVFDAVYL
jgi:hypothetical protein